MKLENKQKLEARLEFLAEKLVENPKATELVGFTIYNIAQRNIRRISCIDSDLIDSMHESDKEFMPDEVYDFIKKKKNLALFCDYVRKEIWKKLDVTNRVPTEAIIRYSVFFNSKKTMKDLIIDNINKAKLLLVCCMEEKDCFKFVPEIDPARIDYVFESVVVEGIIRNNKFDTVTALRSINLSELFY